MVQASSPSKSTSPMSRTFPVFGSWMRLMPTSMTAAPSFTMSAVIRPGIPARRAHRRQSPSLFCWWTQNIFKTIRHRRYQSQMKPDLFLWILCMSEKAKRSVVGIAALGQNSTLSATRVLQGFFFPFWSVGDEVNLKGVGSPSLKLYKYKSTRNNAPQLLTQTPWKCPHQICPKKATSTPCDYYGPLDEPHSQHSRMTKCHLRLYIGTVFSLTSFLCVLSLWTAQHKEIITQLRSSEESALLPCWKVGASQPAVWQLHQMQKITTVYIEYAGVTPSSRKGVISQRVISLKVKCNTV